MVPNAKITTPKIRTIMIDFATPIMAIVSGVQNGKRMDTNPKDAKLSRGKITDHWLSK